jgi:hypothetical protein
MRNLYVILLTLTLGLSACEKSGKEDDDIECPVVDSKSLPKDIVAAFAEKYPNETVITWFNKDNKGYAAFFVSNNVKKIVIFNNEGSFMKEQVKNKQHGQHDNDDEEEGCECETD